MLNFSIKMVESKSFVRLSREGEPQLVLIGPVITESGTLDTEHVAVFLDEDGPHIVARDAIPALLAASECVPVELMTKNRIH